MAQNGSLYLPELSRLFAGEEHIISWYDVPLHTLGASQLPEEDVSYWRSMLATERVRTQIHQDTPFWEGPNPASHKLVEQVTAAINIPPSTDRHYHIHQIKQDTEWVTRQLRVAQFQALRIVLLEWQSRPQLHLQAGYSEAELASLRDVYGESTAFDAAFEASTFRLRDEDEFTSDTARHRRQVFIYFQECIGLARTWLALQDATVADTFGLSTPDDAQTPFPNISSNLEPCLDLLVKVVEEYTNGPQWDVIDDDSIYIWAVGHLFHAKYLMQIVVVAIRSLQNIPIECVRKWFQIMGDVLYLSNIDPSALLPPHEAMKLLDLISLATLAFIDPAGTVAQLDQDPQQHWMSDQYQVSDVHENLLNAVDAECMPAMPAAFAWGLVLQKVRREAIEAKDRGDSPLAQRAIETYDTATGRRSSMPGSCHPSIWEEIIDGVVARSSVPDAITVIIRHTTEKLAVADQLARLAQSSDPDLLPSVRLAKMQLIQELVNISTECLPDGERYGPTVLGPQFALLAPKSLSAADQSEARSACSRFLGVENLLRNVFDTAAARFPYEALPFLRLCRLLALGETFQAGIHYITYRLQTMKSFTHDGDGVFGAYHTIDEEENANRVALDQNAYAFPPAGNPLLTRGENGSTAMIIPAATSGEVISTGDRTIVRWAFEYSGFHLIGEWLERHYNGVLFEVLAERDLPESPTDVASELILLLSNLISSTFSSANEPSHRASGVDLILHETSANLTFGNDIVSLVFDILEQELQAYRRRPANTFDTSVLSASLCFARSILGVKPARFWQHVTKTSLVDPHGGNSLLFTVISSVESLAGNASVTEISALLLQDLISAALRKSSDPAARQWRARPSHGPFNNNVKIYETVLRGMTQNMLSIFESMPSWKASGQQVLILTVLSDSFRRILKYRYCIGSRMSKLTACFGMAADMIIDRLRPENVRDAKSGPITASLLDAVDLLPSFTSSPQHQALHKSLFRLSSIVVEVARAQDLPPAGLEICLLDLSPMLVRNMDLCHGSSARLLQNLLKAVAPRRPVSLLGHLGSLSSIDLLNLLCSAVSSADDQSAAYAWKVLSSLISRDQQWLSIVLLKGTVPDKDKMKHSEAHDAKSIAYRGRLIIDRAVDVLNNIDDRASSADGQRVAKEVLHFVITAQQNWSWTLSTLRSRQDVFATLARYGSETSTEDKTKLGVQRRLIVALITDLTSVHLQYAKSVRDVGLMRVFRPLLEWLTINAIDVASYNTSLHANLSKNFESRFQLDLDDFKSVHMDERDDYEYYNMQSLDFVLEDNAAWNSQGLRSHNNNQSYRAEVDRANDNLHLVESEIALLRSFQNLCIEHAAYFKEDSGIRTMMANISVRCLKANCAKYPAEQLFDNLLQSRTEMTLAMVQRLVQKDCHGSEFSALLKPAWESAIARNPSYDSAISADDLQYWRSSLTVVLLALQFYLGGRGRSVPSGMPNAAELLHKSTSIMPQIIEIATVVIGQGLSTVVSTLQEQKQAQMQQQPRTEKVDIGTKDIALILNVLETILRVAGLRDCISQLSERLISTDTIESAVKLYMWAHLLADESTNNDPVHAELALRILVSLSSLPAVAEEMAVQGVFNTILTARVTQVLQRIPEGVSSLDSRPHCRSLYTVWAEGLLPLSANLLHAVRGPVAGETSTFLNAFPDQLSRASTAFQPRDGRFITLQLAKEISTLSLLSFILDDYRSAGASAAVDPTSIHPLVGFDEHKKTLANDLASHIVLNQETLAGKIVPTTEREAGLLGSKVRMLVQQVHNEMEMAASCLSTANEEISETPAEKS